MKKFAAFITSLHPYNLSLLTSEAYSNAWLLIQAFLLMKEISFLLWESESLYESLLSSVFIRTCNLIAGLSFYNNITRKVFLEIQNTH